MPLLSLINDDGMTLLFPLFSIDPGLREPRASAGEAPLDSSGAGAVLPLPPPL